MGSWAKSDLVHPDGLYPHLADALCAGCGAEIRSDAECYATHDLIWHYQCWPKRDFVAFAPHTQSVGRCGESDDAGR